MKRYLVLLTVLIASAAIAQPDALEPGLHEAESASLQPYYAGDWVQVVDGDYSVMESTTAGDSVSFTVSGSQLVIYRELLAASGGTAEICIDAACDDFTNISSLDQRGIPIAYSTTGTQPTVTITNSDGGTLRLDYFLLLPGEELTPVPAPDPIREHVVLSDGTLAAIDRVITGGDVVSIAIGAAQVAALLGLIVVVAWKK